MLINVACRLPSYENNMLMLGIELMIPLLWWLLFQSYCLYTGRRSLQIWGSARISQQITFCKSQPLIIIRLPSSPFTDLPTHPSQIFLTLPLSCSPWKKQMKTSLGISSSSTSPGMISTSSISIFFINTLPRQLRHSTGGPVLACRFSKSCNTNI